ncbi:GNAT family N-acetyltransferase [Trueperella bernardiae]|uniref:GNAT family N-acetyltransferase n=1 Tax=Trueperella bernardiae TaxID=59561 RepID=UPI000AF48C31|nr:GNAT family N-acetyltransferase [Trueperella bernardiae]
MMSTRTDLRLVPTTESDRTYIARLNFLTETLGDELGDLPDDFDQWHDYYVGNWKPELGGLIAWKGNVPAGGSWLMWGTDDYHGFGHVAEGVPELAIAVERRYAGYGIGSRLIDGVTEIARGAGAPGISLSVDPANEHAHRLYLRLGFEPTGLEAHGHQVLLRKF